MTTKTGRIQEQTTPCVACGKPSTIEHGGNMYCAACRPVTDKVANDAEGPSTRSTPFTLASETTAAAHQVK